LKPKTVTVVGAGLAGSEAAWQVARRGVPVRLYEMRPVRPTAVHQTDGMAELVCSNSLKSLELSSAHGLLKEEMKRLGSLILECAHKSRVPAGSALAVDRLGFSQAVTQAIEEQPDITVVREEVPEIPPDGIVIIAVGPLVSEKLAASIAQFAGQEYLYFYDAIAPVIEADSIDRSIVFAASRYGKGEGTDYLNCPMTAEEYDAFVERLLAGEKAPLHDIDKTPFFEACLPIEEMARRGLHTLRFGPMRPVGLTDPRTGRWANAVVQLRQDNLAAEHYSMVGFQTQLSWPAQKEIIRTIPGLEAARFVRLGQIHRNCYINSPEVLTERLQTRKRPELFFAGQISGVEGYSESAASGILSGINAARLAQGRETLALPKATILGALCHYISHADKHDFQPTNAAFGLLPEAPTRARKKKDRRLARSAQALEVLDTWIAEHGEGSTLEATA
jgi:methylenetetrahydrofolate--tRNA-(uracil-5-)-methyltransferase